MFHPNVVDKLKDLAATIDALNDRLDRIEFRLSAGDVGDRSALPSGVDPFPCLGRREDLDALLNPTQVLIVNGLWSFLECVRQRVERLERKYTWECWEVQEGGTTSDDVQSGGPGGPHVGREHVSLHDSGSSSIGSATPPLPVKQPLTCERLAAHLGSPKTIDELFLALSIGQPHHLRHSKRDIVRSLLQFSCFHILDGKWYVGPEFIRYD